MSSRENGGPDYATETESSDSTETGSSDSTETGSSDSTETESSVSSESEPGTTNKKGWTGTRLVALIAGVAVASMILGVVVMQFVVSPATLAARTAPPEPGPVTAPIEERMIENTVILRGDVSYADSVDVELDGAGGEGRPVVTGHVPQVGALLDAGAVALEVSGRPVLVLPGELPAYRSLSIGMRGPDVTQLKQALNSLGYASGDLGSDIFEWDTAAGLGALYEQLGYSPANGGEEAQQMLRGAERGVRDANVAVAQAQAMLDEAKNSGASNTIGEEAALTSSWEALNDAQVALGEAQAGVLATLPAGEVLFLEGLPRRVDTVSVKRGDLLANSPMSVSGATLTISGSVSQQDASLLSEGLKAFFPGPDGTELSATVQSVTAPSASSGGSDGGSRHTVVLIPDELTPEQIELLRGSNVRLSIPVATTEGEVIAVPIAALSSDSTGGNRVELLIDVKDGPNAETETIDVETGLAADGFVEIRSNDPRITAGAKVVVGR